MTPSLPISPGLLLALGLLIALGCCSCGPSSSGGPSTTEVADSNGSAPRDAADSALADSIEVTADEPRDGWVHGVVRNGSSVDLLGVTLHFDLYDAEGALTGSSHPTRYDLAAGAVGWFHIPLDASEGATEARFVGADVELPYDYVPSN